MAKAPRRRSAIRALPLLLVLGASPTGLVSQAAGPAANSGSDLSPLWWTLTDELSPAELRALHEDPQLNQERFDKAVEAGLWAPIPDLEPGDVRRFYTGAQTPELVPLWIAFQSFALPLNGRTGARFTAQAPRDLGRWGIGGGDAERIVAASKRFFEEAAALRAALIDDQLAFVEILKQAMPRLSEAAYQRTVDARDAGRLAAVTGHSLSRVEALMRVWERDPLAERAAVCLVSLRSQLGPATWRSFRRFLFEDRAPQVIVIDVANYPNPLQTKESP